jgi:branched-chain amino acid transport system ATP-binding protein
VATSVLNVNDVTHFFGGLRAVGNFNLTLEQGQLVGLIGPNGAGKTTIFNLITGVYRPTHGDIVLNGKSLVGQPSFKIAQAGVARTFQTIRLYGDLPVIENVALGRQFHVDYGLVSAMLRLGPYYRGEQDFREKAMDLLDRFGLADRAWESAKNLPYGEQRRLEICRALASDPQLLLLDEPAAGMNPQEVEELMKLITWVHEHFKLTTLLIEHHMRVVMGICPHIVVMDFGEVIARGNPQEIQTNPRVIEAYLGSDDEEAA